MTGFQPPALTVPDTPHLSPYTLFIVHNSFPVVWPQLPWIRWPVVLSELRGRSISCLLMRKRRPAQGARGPCWLLRQEHRGDGWALSR